MNKGIAFTTITVVLSSSAMIFACDKNGSNGSTGTNGLAGSNLRNRNNSNVNNNNQLAARANQQLQQNQRKVGEAQKVVADAAAIASRTEGEFNSTWTRIKSDFEKSTEWTTALNEQKQAQATYDAVRAPILASLKEQNIAYRSAVNQKSTVQERMRELDETPALDPMAKLAMAKEAMEYGSTARKIEAQALATDANVSSAKDRLVQATAKVAAIRNEFEKSLPANGEFQAAKTKLDGARQKEQQARSALAREIDRANNDMNNMYASAGDGRSMVNGECPNKR